MNARLMIESELFSSDEWGDLVSRLGLTSRQAEIVRLILAGRNDRQIAAELRISLPTVRAHLQRVFEVQGVSDRTALVIVVFKCFRESERKIK